MVTMTQPDVIEITRSGNRGYVEVEGPNTEAGQEAAEEVAADAVASNWARHSETYWTGTLWMVVWEIH